MAQYIKQGNIFGRIGSGVGKGLSEQVPKEIEHQRLRSGLQNLANQSDQGDLSPAQFLAQAAGTYGSTPQIIQSFGELAKQQNQANAYRRVGSTQEKPRSSADFTSDLRSIPFANMQPRAEQSEEASSLQSRQPKETVNHQKKTPNVSSNEFNQPEILNENPLNERNFTRSPWTPQQRDQRISDYLDQGFTPDVARQQASDDESRELSEPIANQKRYAELQQRQKEARDELTRQLERKLQKTEKNIYQDITGEMLNNIERGMERDLRLHPNASVNEVANDWTTRALDLAKSKSSFEKVASQTGFSNLFTGSDLSKLKEFSDIFKRAGNSEEFYNLLQSRLSMTPQGSASIAYPRNGKIKEFVKKFKPTSINDAKKRDQNAIKAALEIQDYLTDDDSLLAISRDLREKDPYFDQQAFFDQLSEDKDRLRLNERQRRELTQWVQGISWPDFYILRR